MRADRVFVILLALLAVYQLVWVVAATGSVLFGGDPGAAWVLALMNAAGVALIVTGLRQRSQAPLRAGILLAVGVVPSILMFWVYIPPMIALAVAIYAIQNGLSRSRRQLGT